MFHGSSGCFVNVHHIMEGSYCRIGWLEAGRDLLEVSTMTQIVETSLASLCGVTPRRVSPRFIKSTCIPPRPTLTSRVALLSHRRPSRGLYHYRFTQICSLRSSRDFVRTTLPRDSVTRQPPRSACAPIMLVTESRSQSYTAQESTSHFISRATQTSFVSVHHPTTLSPSSTKASTRVVS